ncbi:hypothetical protein [Nocardia flavorosea]|uniref:hypothetical protein n=1 Tax=Nocardia flavorosea TaxID=53429 RepID=UPI002453D5AF|nr:hypothetical protein [Nocardia flavorosea]
MWDLSATLAVGARLVFARPADTPTGYFAADHELAERRHEMADDGRPARDE